MFGSNDGLAKQLLAAVILLAPPAHAQVVSFQVRPKGIPAGRDSTIYLSFSTFSNPFPPELYESVVSGHMGVRWKAEILPVRFTTTLGPASTGLEFDVPSRLCRPGLSELVLWNRKLNQPLPYRAWISVLIPTSATVFEADPERNRVVAYESDPQWFDSGGGRIVIYELSTGTLLGSIPVEMPQRVLTFSPDTQLAWLAVDAAKGRLARLNLDTQKIDQEIQITEGTPPYNIRLQIPASNPNILIAAVQSVAPSVVVAYLNGLRLPGVVQGAGVVPHRGDDRVLMSDGRTCTVSETQGLGNCAAAPPVSATFQAVWGNRGYTSRGMVDMKTGQVIAMPGALFQRYVASSNRVLVNRDERFGYPILADAETGQRIADLSNLFPTFIMDAALLHKAPDWIFQSVVASESTRGLIAARVPQLTLRPTIRTGSAVHGATLVPGSIAPGQILTILGEDLGPEQPTGPVLETATKLATEVERVKVLFDGVPAPILYAGPGQVNVVAPETIRTNDNVSIQIVHYDIASPRVAVPVSPTSPGLFGYPLDGKTYAAGLTAAGALQGPSNPLRRGTVATLFATGLGLPYGMHPSDIPVRACALATPPSISVGGRPATVLYAGCAPGLTIGVAQINLVVPDDAPLGPSVEVAIKSGAKSQGGVWVSVE